MEGAERQAGEGEVVALPTDDEVRDRVRAAVERLRRDPSRRYVRFEDLALDPKPHLDRAVSLLSVPQGPEVGGASPHFLFGPPEGAFDAFRVSMQRLPREAQKRLLQFAYPRRLVALSASLRRAPNGAFCLEAESYQDFGARSDTVDVEGLR